MIPRYKILSLKAELDIDIESLEKKSQNVTTTQEYNNIQILIGEKERIVEKLINILR